MIVFNKFAIGLTSLFFISVAGIYSSFAECCKNSSNKMGCCSGTSSKYIDSAKNKYKNNGLMNKKNTQTGIKKKELHKKAVKSKEATSEFNTSKPENKVSKNKLLLKNENNDQLNSVNSS